MKQIFLALLILLFASSVYAEKTVTGGSSLAIGASGTTFMPSTNVTVKILSTATAYTAASFHASGNRGYATTQDSGIAESDNEVSAIATISTAGTLPTAYSY